MSVIKGWEAAGRPGRRERPILFSGPMVRAILEGRKSQTRRVISPTQPRADGLWPAGRDPRPDCPYGQPGDRLWVRETFYCDDYRYPNGPVDELRAALEYRASHDCTTWEAGCPCRGDDGRSDWRPSIHMPRWASRLTLEVTDVRVQRLQDISEEDALSEGFVRGNFWPRRNEQGAFHLGPVWSNAREAFQELWDSINGERPGRSWETNPWVWAITFNRITDERKK